MAFVDWSARLSTVGASVTEVQAIGASYQLAGAGVQAALDALIAAGSNDDLRAMLNAWRANAGPFQDGYPGGGLPFGTKVPILTGQTADDTYAIAAGTGIKLASVNSAAVGGLYPVDTGWNRFLGAVPANIVPAAAPGDNTKAYYNLCIGRSAGAAVTVGYHNVAIGDECFTANTTGIANAALGEGALYLNTTGSLNTAIGCNALEDNTTGSSNVAVGNAALANMLTASFNTAVGANALGNNDVGQGNTAVGFSAMVNATATAAFNVGVGYAALEAVTGTLNVAVGDSAGLAITSGTQNVALGALSLKTATTANNNTALGYQALTAATGGANTAVGGSAGSGIVAGTFNTVVGLNAGAKIVAQANNTCLGYNAGNTDGTTATTDNSSMTLIGEQAQATTGNVIVLGKAVATRPNLIFGGVGAAAAFGGGVGVFAIANAATAPTSNPTGGGVLYVVDGALTWRGSSGTVTTIAPA